MCIPLCLFSPIVGSAIFSHQTIHFVSPISEPNCSNIWHWQKGCQWYLDTFTRCPGIVNYRHLCNAASMALRATPNQQTDITKRLRGSLDDAGLPPGSKLLCLRHHASQQRLQRTQIIWVCSDIWVFSDLDNRLFADNLSHLPKVAIWISNG